MSPGGSTDVTARIATLYGAAPSVSTFVIGIGAATNTDPTLLNAWADAGHTARSGATHYYQTNSSADLMAAFDAIAGGIVSCDFQMTESAPDPTLITVTEITDDVAARTEQTARQIDDRSGWVETLWRLCRRRDHGENCASANPPEAR